MLNRTFREVDGERIDGLSRPAFIRDGGHYILTELVVYASSRRSRPVRAPRASTTTGGLRTTGSPQDATGWAGSWSWSVSELQADQLRG
ncbi:hypothetical protein GCM10023334_017390 [Nonomuraea thailandensis]|uniref:DUF7638 domain-containing protein n=1 Tax=Nonomuraea thailandensis TaxID=1188745 RepID=UPI00336E796D